VFRQLMNFSCQRNALQALGWYLAYLLIGTLIGIIIVLVFGPSIRGVIREGYSEATIQAVRRMIPYIVVPYQIVLAVALLRSRWRSVLSILLALLAVLLSLFFALVVGLIPLAVLTTRPTQVSAKDFGEVFK